MKIDDDLKGMTDAQLRREVMRLRRACRKELGSVCNQRCWVNILEVLPEGKKIRPLDLPEIEFIGNCRRYYRRNQS